MEGVTNYFAFQAQHDGSAIGIVSTNRNAFYLLARTATGVESGKNLRACSWSNYLVFRFRCGAAAAGLYTFNDEVSTPGVHKGKLGV